MQSQFKQQITRAFARNLLIVPAIVLAGCGGGGGGSASTGDTTDLTATAKPSTTNSAKVLTLEGIAMKGAISGGLVTVYGVEQHASYYQVSQKPLAEAVRTAADGSYRIQIKAPTTPGLIVRVSTDAQSRMLCDVTAGCEDTSGATVAFGSAMALPADFSMSAAAATGTDKKQTVHVTPLSHLAYSWAAGQTAGLTAENIADGRVQITTALGLPSNTLDKAPLDLTKLDATTPVDADALQYSLVSASFLSLANEAGWEDISDVLDSAAQTFASDSGFVGVNQGGLPTVTQYDLLTATADIASDLSIKAGGSSNLTSTLAQISQTASTAASTLLNQGSELLPVQITFHPSSVSILERETVTLNVNASGSGPISYQWRKNGVAITGATSEHLTISSASLSDGGIYDCIVSNGAGSVTSLAANVTVEDASVVLNWTVPSSRVDGTPLDASELKGYRILYGASADNLDQAVEIQDPFTTEYSFGDLPSNTYFFAIKAIDADGLESGLSGVVSRAM